MTQKQNVPDLSWRPELEYRMNEAGAKEYINELLADIHQFNGPMDLYLLKDSRITGSIKGFNALGLVDIFTCNEYFQKQSFAFNSYKERLLES